MNPVLHQIVPASIIVGFFYALCKAHIYYRNKCASQATRDKLGRIRRATYDKAITALRLPLCDLVRKAETPSRIRLDDGTTVRTFEISEDHISDILKEFVGHHGDLLQGLSEAERCFERCVRARRWLCLLTVILSAWVLIVGIAAIVSTSGSVQPSASVGAALTPVQRKALWAFGGISAIIALPALFAYLTEWSAESRLQKMYDRHVEGLGG